MKIGKAGAVSVHCKHGPHVCSATVSGCPIQSAARQYHPAKWIGSIRVSSTGKTVAVDVCKSCPVRIDCKHHPVFIRAAIGKRPVQSIAGQYQASAGTVSGDVED